MDSENLTSHICIADDVAPMVKVIRLREVRQAVRKLKEDIQFLFISEDRSRLIDKIFGDLK